MDLENLQTNWNRAGAASKSREELQQMTRLRKHPQVNRIRIKFLIEALLLMAFVVIYYDAFDGQTKPLWANLLPVASGLAYLLTRYLGWRLLQNPVKDTTLKSSLQQFRQQLNRMAISVLISSFLFGGSVIVFFTATLTFTAEKYFLLAGMLATLVLFVYLSWRIWNRRVKRIGEVIGEMEE